jgi:hypothetical protein
MKMRWVTIRVLLWLWLAVSATWVVLVAIYTWREIPRDDWVSVPERTDDQLASAEAVLRPITGLFDSPTARAIVMDNIGTAFLPPIIILASIAIFIWASRKAYDTKSDER